MNKKKVIAISNEIAAKNAYVRQIRNSITDETRAAAEAAIAEKEAEVESLKIALQEAEDDTEDKSAELQKRVDELTGKLKEVENSLKVNKESLAIVNYLDSKESEKDFFKILKNSTSGESFRTQWADHCRTIQNDIDPNNVLFPTPITSRIIDNLSKAGKVWSLLNHTGLMGLKIAVNTLVETAETARAGRHTKGQSKAEDAYSLSAKTLTPQAVFELVSLDYETIRTTTNEVKLLEYVVNKLTSGIVRELERCVLVGDGRTAGAARKITSFDSLATMTAGVFMTSSVSASATVPTLEEVRTMVDNITHEAGIVLVVSKATKTALQKFIYASGGNTTYITDEQLAGQLGVEQIITSNVVTAANGALAIAFCPSAYSVVGDNSPENIQMYNISNNTNQYEAVGLFGGGLTEVYAAARLTPKAS